MTNERSDGVILIGFDTPNIYLPCVNKGRLGWAGVQSQDI